MFIGAIVGAGFATGKEVILYFSDKGFITPVIAGLMMGAVSGIFLLAGKYKPAGRVWAALDRAVNFAVFAAMAVTFAVMCSALEELSTVCFGVKLFGLIGGLVCAVLSSFDIKFIKNISSVLVILLIVAAIILYAMCTKVHMGNIIFLPAAQYCGMNMLTGGYLIIDEGKNMSVKQIWLCAMLNGIMAAVLLGMVYTVAYNNPLTSMPVYVFAAGRGMQMLGGLLIISAILSTLIGAGRVAFIYMQKFFDASAMPVVFLCGLAATGFTLEFAISVDTFYPMIGYFGIAATAICFILLAAATRRKFLPLFRRRT